MKQQHAWQILIQRLPSLLTRRCRRTTHNDVYGDKHWTAIFPNDTAGEADTKHASWASGFVLPETENSHADLSTVHTDPIGILKRDQMRARILKSGWLKPRPLSECSTHATPTVRVSNLFLRLVPANMGAMHDDVLTTMEKLETMSKKKKCTQYWRCVRGVGHLGRNTNNTKGENTKNFHSS